MKKIMRRIFIMVFMLLFVISLSGCGIYRPPIITENPYDEEDPLTPPGGNKDPSKDPNNDEPVFTVTLYSEGRRFSPNVIFYAQWTSDDKTEIVNAPFNALGVAQTTGLDGEYRVTLSGLPDDYTYDPNGIYVDNDHRDVSIELLTIIETPKSAPKYESSIVISQLGTYRHTFESADESVWYQYFPQAQGKYVIESWVDVTENEINPTMEWFYGNPQYVNIDYPAGTYDDGSTSSTFSKNFKFELELSSGMVGNVWIFRLFAACKGELPIDVDFTIKLVGDYSGTDDVFDPVLPNGPFRIINPEGKWTYNYADNDKVLDSKRFKLNWVDVNNNGKYDSEYTDLNLNGKFDEGDEWRDTNGDGVYTPSVDQWWDLNGNGRFDLNVDLWIDNGNGRPECGGDEWIDTNKNGKFDEGDPWRDENGNGVCDFDLGDGYYREYDPVKYADNDGWGPILFAKLNKDIEVMNYGDDGGGGHFANPNVRLRFDGKDYINFMETYFKYCNKEGAHPVTKELKDFLQHYASTQSLFCDGESLAETHYGLKANEEDMWLFACGYFR